MRKFAVTMAQEGGWFVARCPQLSVTSQGRTVPQAELNIREAVQLYVESFGLGEAGDTSVEGPWMTVEV